MEYDAERRLRQPESEHEHSCAIWDVMLSDSCAGLRLSNSCAMRKLSNSSELTGYATCGHAGPCSVQHVALAIAPERACERFVSRCAHERCPCAQANTRRIGTCKQTCASALLHAHTCLHTRKHTPIRPPPALQNPAGGGAPSPATPNSRPARSGTPASSDVSSHPVRCEDDVWSSEPEGAEDEGAEGALQGGEWQGQAQGQQELVEEQAAQAAPRTSACSARPHQASAAVRHVPLAPPATAPAVLSQPSPSHQACAPADCPQPLEQQQQQQMGSLQQQQQIGPLERARAALRAPPGPAATGAGAQLGRGGGTCGCGCAHARVCREGIGYLST